MGLSQSPLDGGPGNAAPSPQISPIFLPYCPCHIQKCLPSIAWVRARSGRWWVGAPKTRSPAYPRPFSEGDPLRFIFGRGEGNQRFILGVAHKSPTAPIMRKQHRLLYRNSNFPIITFFGVGRDIFCFSGPFHPNTEHPYV